VRLTILRASCDNGRTCPNINRAGHGTLVVQGYPATAGQVRAAGLADDRGGVAVWIPVALVPEVLLASGGGSTWGILDGDRVVIFGAEVSDPEVLAELDLPVGESAIEIPVDVLAFLGAGVLVGAR
jgi:hypothetical protein